MVTGSNPTLHEEMKKKHPYGLICELNLLRGNPPNLHIFPPNLHIFSLDRI